MHVQLHKTRAFFSLAVL